MTEGGRITGRIAEGCWPKCQVKGPGSGRSHTELGDPAFAKGDSIGTSEGV